MLDKRFSATLMCDFDQRRWGYFQGGVIYLDSHVQANGRRGYFSSRKGRGLVVAAVPLA